MKRSPLKRTPFKSTAPSVLRLAEPKVAKPRLRKCVICKEPFTPRGIGHKVCGANCAHKLVEMNRAKRERQEDAKKKMASKGLSYWEGRAQRACNAYICKRDPDVCISCGVTRSPAWQAGHYISVGANSTLRYNPLNINKQCVQCNMHLASNAIKYRIGLVQKIGLEAVEALEAWHPPVKMTIEYVQEVEATYKQKLKELNNGD